MKRAYPILFVLALLSFFTPTMQPFSAITGGVTTRWVMLAVIAAATLLPTPGRVTRCPRELLVMVGLFCLYALISMAWSENSRLTLYKAGAFTLVSFSFLVGGSRIAAWTTNPFFPLAPMYIFAVGSSLVALVLRPETAYGGQWFQGYVYGPNMLGSLIACSAPWMITQLRLSWSSRSMRTAALAGAAAGIGILLMSRSRASMAMSLVMSTFVLLGLRLERRLMLVCLAAVAVVAIVAYYPAVTASTTQMFAYKGSSTLLATREEAYAVSLDMARMGGVHGVGFGISSGDSAGWSGQVSSVAFSREKGNALLAVWEELGVAGVWFYVGLNFIIWQAIWRSRRWFFRDDPRRHYLFLGGGYAVGALVMLMFEAWFTSPGSPESAAFWAVLGLTFGALSEMPRDGRALTWPQAA